MKSRWTALLSVLLAVSLVVHGFTFLGNRSVSKQIREQNEADLHTIAIFGENLANRLEEFLQYANENENDEIKEILDDSWRIVFGQGWDIRFFLNRMTPHNMGKKREPKWDLLQYGLLRTMMILDRFNIQFLKQRSYNLTHEDRQKLEAVVAVLRIMQEENEKKSDYPERVIDLLTEQLVIIDDYYLDSKKRTER